MGQFIRLEARVPALQVGAKVTNRQGARGGFVPLHRGGFSVGDIAAWVAAVGRRWPRSPPVAVLSPLGPEAPEAAAALDRPGSGEYAFPEPSPPLLHSNPKALGTGRMLTFCSPGSNVQDGEALLGVIWCDGVWETITGRGAGI